MECIENQGVSMIDSIKLANGDNIPSLGVGLDREGALRRSLKILELGCIDLYMIQWEVPGCTLNT